MDPDSLIIVKIKESREREGPILREKDTNSIV